MHRPARPPHDRTEAKARHLALAACALLVLAIVPHATAAEPVAVAPEYLDASGELKVAPDLIERLDGPRTLSAATTRLVFRFSRAVDDSATAALLDRLAAGSAQVLPHLGLVVADVRLSDLEAELANDVDDVIDYVVPDRPLMITARAGGIYGTLEGPASSSPSPPTVIESHVRITTGASVLAPDATAAGTGVSVAVIDSGVAEHADLLDGQGNSRILLHMDFTGDGDPRLDPLGHGTHVAGLVAGSGSQMAGAGRPSYRGVAPAVSLVDLRVLRADGSGELAGLLAALDWVAAHHAEYGIRVINLSLGTAPHESWETDPLCQAVESLIDLGLTVVASAGNFGRTDDGQKVYGGIVSPGIAPRVITVGAANSLGTDPRSDDILTTYSSRGPTRAYHERDLDGDGTFEESERDYDHLIKPDLLAPGNAIVSTAALDSELALGHPELIRDARYMELSGSSMAAPQVAGVAALLYQRRPDLTPELVRALLMFTAQRINDAGVLEQGAGLLNAAAAGRLADALVASPGTLATGAAATAGFGLDQVRSETIAGESIPWGRRLIYASGWAFADELYRAGFAWQGYGGMASEATILADTDPLAPGFSWPEGLLWADGR
ncbi:MAG: hypothetical protein D6738_05240, partial [Acidobacteria bacterium]